jgi:DNA-binding transcriptional LysR family regulator
MALTSLALAHDDIVTLKAGLTGQAEVGVIMTPAMALLPRAIARVKEEAPLLRIGVQLEASNVLLDKLQHGTLDFMIGRIFDTIDTTGLIYEELTEEPACAVVRPGHPLLLENRELALKDIAPLPWILPPPGSILRYRFDMMFRRAGLEPPSNVVDTTAMLVITALLQQTDSLHVMPLEVAQHYASLNVMRILPIELPCKMDAFGIIRQRDHLLSPGADLLLRAVRAAAAEIY